MKNVGDDSVSLRRERAKLKKGIPYSTVAVHVFPLVLSFMLKHILSFSIIIKAGLDLILSDIGQF